MGRAALRWPKTIRVKGPIHPFGATGIIAMRPESDTSLAKL